MMESQPCLNSVQVRCMKESEIDDVLDLILKERWFITKPKLDIIYHENFSQVYVLEDVRDSNILGIAFVTKTRDQEAIMGNVIIKESFRGKGLGTYLMREVFKYTTDVTLTWFSVADSLYKKLGCKIIEGETGHFVSMDVNREKVNSYCQSNKPAFHVKVIPFTESRMDDLVQYDKEARGCEAKAFLSLLNRTEDEILLAVSGSDDRIVGYTAIQTFPHDSPFLNGLYADDDKIAALLFRESLAVLPGCPKVQLFMMDSLNNFLVQFGIPDTTSRVPMTRFYHSGPGPVRIPEEKLYSLCQVDIA